MLLVEHLASVLKQEQLGLPPDMLTLIAHQSQVLVRKALSLLDQAISYARYDVKLHDIAQALGIIDHRAITLLVTAIVQCNADRALKEVQDGEHAGYDLTKLMTQLAWYIHNITLVQVLNEPAGCLPHLTPNELSVLQQMAKLRSKSDWQRIFAATTQLTLNVSHLPTLHLMLEMGMLQLMLLTPTSELSNLLVQLDNVLVHSPMPLRPQVTINSAPAPSRSVAADTSVNFPCMQGDEIEAAQGPKKASVPSVQSNDQAMASAALPTPSSQAANSWCVLVDDVCKARPALAFVLKRSHLIAFGHEAVQVVFEHKTFWWHAANNAYKRSLICSLLCKQFSEDIALQIVALDALSGQRECKSCEGWQAIEVQALAHEGVHAIASILGREVRCIEPVQNEVVDNQLGAHLTKSDERWAAMTPSQGSFWSSHACLAIASALQHISPTTSSTPCSITHSKASPVSLHMPLKRSSRASLGDSNAKH